MIEHILVFSLKEDDDWVADAACGEPGAPGMFPKPTDKRGVADARRTCLGCPVRAQCLDMALKNGEQHGVWGGLTTDERHDLARRRRERDRIMATADQTQKTASTGWIKGERYETITLAGEAL